jgi:chromosome condensin MukBEF MukE localization factor
MNQFPRSQIHIILNDFSEFLRIFLELFSDFLRSEVNQKFFLAILSSILVNNFKLVEIFVQFSKLLIFLSLTSENLSKLSSDSFSFSAFIRI